MHLVGFIIRIYHDARSPERQIPYGRFGIPIGPIFKGQESPQKYLNFFEAYSSSKAAFFGSQTDRFYIFQKPFTQSFPVFFSLLNLSSVPFLSAHSMAYSSRPQNRASESLQKSADYFSSSFGNVALKRSREVGTVTDLSSSSFSKLVQALQSPHRLTSCFLQLLDAV